MASRPAFPDPLVIYPVSSHRYTFIILHGRGSSAQRFGPTLLETPVHPSHAAARTDGSQAPTADTLRTMFPHAKFVFPTAPPRRAVIYKRVITNQVSNSRSLVVTQLLVPPESLRKNKGVPQNSYYRHFIVTR